MNLADKILKDTECIIPLSMVINRIIDIVNDSDKSLSDLADIIRFDIALTANLLKLCNSAFYGFPVHVDSVDHAVKLLGMKKTVELALIGSIGQKLNYAQEEYGLKKGELWTSSVASALLAKSFMENRSSNSDVVMIFTASLLKDIGKLVIKDYVGKSLSKIHNLVHNKGFSFDEAETKVIGINHAEIGALIAERWDFNPKMVYLIRNHHLSDVSARKDFETAVIYLAETVSRMANIGIGTDGLAYRVHDEIFGFLCVSEMDLKELMIDFQLNLNIAQKLFHII